MSEELKPCPFCGGDAELLEALKNILVTIENSEEWWMDCPDRGGFDTDIINKILAKADGETKV